MSRVLFSTMSRMYSAASEAIVILRWRKKFVIHPCFLSSNISQKIFRFSFGTAATIFLFTSPANPELTRRSVASSAGEETVFGHHRRFFALFHLGDIQHDNKAMLHEKSLVSEAA